MTTYNVTSKEDLENGIINRNRTLPRAPINMNQGDWRKAPEVLDPRESPLNKGNIPEEIERSSASRNFLKLESQEMWVEEMVRPTAPLFKTPTTPTKKPKTPVD